MTRQRLMLTCAAALALTAASASAAIGQEQGRTTSPPAKPAPARATPHDPARAGAFELLVGGEYLLSESLGTVTATMLANNTGTSPYNYFTTQGSRQAAPALRGAIGYNITSTLTVEGGFLWSRGNVAADISNDAEKVAATTATGRITQYEFDASLVARMTQFAFSRGAGVPYLEAGAGYLRQMLEGNYAKESGQIYHVGGGVQYLWKSKPQSRMSGIGFRTGARVYVRQGGLSFDDSSATYVGVIGGLLVVF